MIRLFDALASAGLSSPMLLGAGMAEALGPAVVGIYLLPALAAVFVWFVRSASPGGESAGAAATGQDGSSMRAASVRQTMDGPVQE